MNKYKIILKDWNEDLVDNELGEEHQNISIIYDIIDDIKIYHTDIQEDPEHRFELSLSKDGETIVSISFGMEDDTRRTLTRFFDMCDAEYRKGW